MHVSVVFSFFGIFYFSCMLDFDNVGY